MKLVLGLSSSSFDCEIYSHNHILFDQKRHQHNRHQSTIEIRQQKQQQQQATTTTAGTTTICITPSRTKKERQVVREMARHRARIVMEIEDSIHTNNINNNDSSKPERVPITYRAYLSCRLQEEDMTKE